MSSDGCTARRGLAETDGRTLILSRYTELNADQRLLVKQLKLELPRNLATDYRRRPDHPGTRARPVVKP
jgi:hypothetical protein